MRKSDKKRTPAALPTVRVISDDGTFCALVRALLEGRFTCVSDDPSPCLTVTDLGFAGGVSLDGEGHETLSRPFTPEVFTEAAQRAAGAARLGRSAGNPREHTVSAGGRTVRLTATEYRLYSALAGKEDFVTPEELSTEVWGRADAGLCAVYVSYLRRKLAPLLGDGFIISVRGKGYKVSVNERDTL